MKSACDMCGELRQLHRATKYSPAVGHFIPMALCSECQGPANSPTDRRPEAQPYQLRREVA